MSCLNLITGLDRSSSPLVLRSVSVKEVSQDAMRSSFAPSYFEAMNAVDFLPAKRSRAVWTRPRIYLLSRSIICVVVILSIGSLFLRPANFLQYIIDILLRTYLMFVGTVMAHEGVHGHLGGNRSANFHWGRIALLPTMVPFTNFRKTHHLHHAYTNVPDRDPDHFMKSRNRLEIILRAIAMPHHWFFWLWKRGRIRKQDLIELLLNYLVIFAVYGVVLASVGASRLFWGMAPPLVLVSILLWYPFAVKTHEGFSTGVSELRSHNYYGRFMYWFSLGLGMHREHHSQPKLSWIELREYVEDAPFARGKFLSRDIRIAAQDNEVTNGQLSVIDRVFSLMDTHQRPMDFTLSLQLKNAPAFEALRTGARSARNLYPSSGSIIDNQHWVRCLTPDAGISAISVCSAEEVANAVEEFVDRPLDLDQQMPVQQLVITNGSEAEIKLVTRFHHATADGLSATLWLNHQLRVAYEKEAPVTEVSFSQSLPLRTHSSPVRKSESAYGKSSHRLWTRHAKPSRARRWRTIELSASELRLLCRRAGGFTYNDLLATCALQVFTRWNHLHVNGRRQRIGLWLPINIRQQSAAGFGNGSSRIRLYARYNDGISLLNKCREIRRQIVWSTRHGEWAVPTELPLSFLAPWTTNLLLRAYLNRPGVDMASGVFSHVEIGAGESGDVFQCVEKIESVGLLHRHYCVAITGATRGGRTWLTFTYDPALLSGEDIERLVAMYEEELDLAQREFA